MITKELIEKVTKRTGAKKSEVERIYFATQNELIECFQRGENYMNRSLGTFTVKESGVKKGHNFHTGETIPIPPKNIVKFKKSKTWEI